ncbi:MAG TPA: YcnI family protein [Actinocrinis sp.]|nr:YcnI family protein [Actinocrinis sp.]
MPAPRPSRTLRAAGVLLAVPVLVLAAAGAASAHVTVSPTSAPQGSTQELTFKVPNEESGANTVSLQLQIPTADPIAQVLAKPVPGWTVTLHTVTLAKPLTTDDGTFSTAVDEVDWTGGTIVPGQYQDFSISVDPLPADATQLVFKAVQTYSNGDVVRWIDLSAPGQPDPDHPAPVLALTPAGSDSDSAGTTGTSTGPANTPDTAVPPAAAGTNTTTGASSTSSGNGLGIAGLIVGALGLLAAGYALWRTRRPADPGDRA